MSHRKGLQGRKQEPYPHNLLTMNIMHGSGMTQNSLLPYVKVYHLLKRIRLACRTTKILADWITVPTQQILARSSKFYRGIKGSFISFKIITRAVLRTFEHESFPYRRLYFIYGPDNAT